MLVKVMFCAAIPVEASSVKVNDYVKKILYQKRERNKNENDRWKKNENEIGTKMIDGKTNKNDNENESLHENNTEWTFAVEVSLPPHPTSSLIITDT